MVLEAGVNETFDVDVTLDREIAMVHTLRIMVDPPLQLYNQSSVAVGSITLSFAAGEHDIAQPVRVSGSSPGTFPLECVASAGYYQRLGELKEEQSEVLVTILPEQPGWNGSIPSVKSNSNSNTVRGNLFFRYDHTGGTQTISFRRTSSNADFTLLWCEGPTGNIQVTPSAFGFSPADRRATITMTTAGIYRFYVYDSLTVSTSAVGDATWYAKLGNTTAVGSAPYLDGTYTKKSNWVRYVANIDYPQPNFQVFSYGANHLLEVNCCGTVTTHQSVNNAGNSQFSGNCVVTGLFTTQTDGYWILGAASVCGANWGPSYYVNGIAIGSNSVSRSVLLRHG